MDCNDPELRNQDITVDSSN